MKLHNVIFPRREETARTPTAGTELWDVELVAGVVRAIFSSEPASCSSLLSVLLVVRGNVASRLLLPPLLCHPHTLHLDKGLFHPDGRLLWSTPSCPTHRRPTTLLPVS